MKPVVLHSVITDVQVRFADTDMLGHINNTAYAAFTEVGRSDFFTNLEGDAPWFVLARLETDFRREAFLQDALQVRTRVESLGTTSMTLRQDIWRDETLVVSTKCVLVCIDRETRAKGTIPASWMMPTEDMAPVHVTRLHAVRGGDRA